MAVFPAVPGGCGGGGCECSECATGTICVALVAPCTLDDLLGVLITVYVHGTLTVAGSALTASDGTACISGLPFGDYDVVGTKADCIRIDFPVVTALGCETRTLTGGQIVCLPYASRRFRVLGCFGEPLPGATVTVTGPAGGVAITGSDGVAYFYYIQTGVYTATISHPSGRFTPQTLASWTVASVCDASNSGDTTLLPTGLYQCCDVQKQVTPTSPYPIPKTLRITDSGGSDTFAANGSCGGVLCVDRTMPNTTGDPRTSMICHDATGHAFIAVFPPATVGESAVSTVDYILSLTATTASLSQATPDASVLAPNNGLTYKAAPDPAVNDGCLPDTQVLWRTASTCASPVGTAIARFSTGYTINSIYPLNITFAFASGTGFGPAAYPAAMLTGDPFSTSVVVSE